MENGFLLNDGAKKKALFVPVKQYPDVILYAVGGSALDGGRRLTLFARFLCFFPLLVSVRASLLWIFSDYIVVCVCFFFFCIVLR